MVEEEQRKTREFPLGDGGDKVIKAYAAARALRDLGAPDAQAKKDFKLDDAKTTVTVTFKAGGPRTFLLGGSVYGGTDRYAIEPASGKVYVLSRDMVASIETGISNLQLQDPKGFDITKVESVTIAAGGKTKTAVRVTAGAEGQQVKTWGDPATKKTNQTLANFIDNANNLRPVEYAAGTKLDGVEPVVTLTYKDERGALLGTLALYKREKTAELPAGGVLDPANPPKGESEYLIMTPRTRVPAAVRKDVAQRTEQDIATVFSDNPVQSVDPKGNPFGNAPIAPGGPAPGGLAPGGLAPGGAPHGMPGADPHGHGMAPAAGSAAAPTGTAPAPAPTGAAAPPVKAPAPTGAAPAGAAPAVNAPAAAAPAVKAPAPAVKAPAPAVKAPAPAAAPAAPTPAPAAPVAAPAAPAP